MDIDNEDNIRQPDEVVREQLLEDTRSDYEKDIEEAIYYTFQIYDFHMCEFHKFLIMVAAITAIIEQSKHIKHTLALCSLPIWKVIVIIDFVANVLSQVIIAYKFPTLFMSFMSVKIPLVQAILKDIYSTITE